MKFDVNDSASSEEITTSLDNVKSWLISRRTDDIEDKAVISAPEGLRSIGFADLVLEKTREHQESWISCYDFATQKLKGWTELSHLVNWSAEFLSVVKNNKLNLTTLDLLRGSKEFPISLAKYHVEEAISALVSALSFELGQDIQHPDTRGQSYAVSSILIDDSVGPHDVIRQTFTCLYSKCAVRLVVKSNHYYSAIMVSYIVDLMHQSGATASEVDCVAFDRRESIGNEKFSKCVSPNKNSKLSVIAAVFRQTDTFAAARGIIESYFRELYPNLIVMVEEAAYERFIKDWQRYYSNVLHIGARADSKSSVVEQFNSKVQIDLEAIDIKASHKMTGNVINVLKFRTLADLTSLLANLRKVPHMSVWNDDILLTREFCLRVNQCNEFWINHIPKSLSSRKFSEDMLNFYSDTVAEDMTHIYNSVYAQFSDEVEQLRKTHATFMKKESRLKTMLVIQAFSSMLTKSKSLRNGNTVAGSITKLKRFQQGLVQKISTSTAGNSLVETIMKPVGMAMLLVREESSIKSKALLVEFIFKNLILGNAVLLICPHNTLGARFTFENDHVIPFKMVNEDVPDISRLSLENSIEVSEVSMSRKQCPKNTYAIEILPDMTSENYEAVTVALGSRQKSLWFPDVEQTNYWLNE